MREMATVRRSEPENERESLETNTKTPRAQIARPAVIPQLVSTRTAAEMLGRSPATLKRWRYEGVGPGWIEMERRVSHDVAVLLEFVRKNTRTPSVQAAREDAQQRAHW